MPDPLSQAPEPCPAQQDKDNSSVVEFYLLSALDPVCGGQVTSWRAHS